MDQKLKESIASELQVAPETLTAGCKLDSLENWDSVNKLTVMVLLGDAVGAPVDPGEIAKLVTFGDIETLVASKRK